MRTQKERDLIIWGLINIFIGFIFLVVSSEYLGLGHGGLYVYEVICIIMMILGIFSFSWGMADRHEEYEGGR